MSGLGDGSGLNAPLVVFLVIVGAAAVVTCGYAVHRLFFINDAGDRVFDKPSTEQEAYMRQVRLRNMGGNWGEAREAAASRQTR